MDYCYGGLSNIYDYLIKPDIDYKYWANTILDICNYYKINNIDYLDLACGTANLTIELFEYFKNVWAVDLSNEMLAVAEEKFREKGYNKATFICQDICKLNLNKQFDLITCCLDSVNYILKKEDLKNFFNGVNRCLKENGIFIFDINSYYKLTKILGNNIYNYDDDDLVYVWDNNLQDGIVEMYLTFFIKDGEYYKRFDEVHFQRAYKVQEIIDLLQECGLAVVSILNNYKSVETNKYTERFTFIVKKQ